MFRMSSESEYEQGTEGGTRYLFELDSFEFHDALDADGALHHFVLETTGEEPGIFEVDQRAMYEFMARFLAGEYEKEEYALERSPAHEALLDLLEVAAARARGGETDLELDMLEDVEEMADGEQDGDDEEDR